MQLFYMEFGVSESHTHRADRQTNMHNATSGLEMTKVWRVPHRRLRFRKLFQFVCEESFQAKRPSHGMSFVMMMLIVILMF